MPSSPNLTFLEMFDTLLLKPGLFERIPVICRLIPGFDPSSPASETYNVTESFYAWLPIGVSRLYFSPAKAGDVSYSKEPDSCGKFSRLEPFSSLLKPINLPNFAN